MAALSDAVDQFIYDTAIAHVIVHGGDNTVVETDGGPVRTFAKVIKDLEAESYDFIIANAESLLNQVREVIDQAAQEIAGELLDDNSIRSDRTWSSAKISEELSNVSFDETPLTNLPPPENDPIADGDTILVALSKLQGQVDNKSNLNHTHPIATHTESGFMSFEDKIKMDGIEAGATKNATDAQLRDRSTHTGVQPMSSVEGLVAALEGKANVVHTHNASDIVSGTLADARLNARVGTVAATISDWNAVGSNGWYRAQDAANQPPDGAGWYMGYVLVHNADYITQTVWKFAEGSSTNSRVWRRAKMGATNGWQAWYRLRMSEAELDARYLQSANASTQPQASTIVLRDSAGNGAFNAVSIQTAVTTRNSDNRFFSSSDNFIRPNTAAGFLASLNMTPAITPDPSSIVRRETSGAIQAYNYGSTMPVATTNDDNVFLSGKTYSGTHWLSPNTPAGMRASLQLDSNYLRVDQAIPAGLVNDASLAPASNIGRFITSVKNIQSYGAVGDGSTDNTAAINAAIADSANSLLLFPPGVYVINGTINIGVDNIWLFGYGEGVTILRHNHPTNSMIVIGTSSTMRDNVRISGFKFEGTPGVTKTSGSLVRVENSHNIRIDHVRCGYDVWDNFEFLGGQSQYLYYLTDFEINDGENGIVVSSGGTSGGPVQDLWISNGLVAAQRSAGLLIYNGSGVYTSDVGFLSCYNGVAVSPAAGKVAQFLFFNGVVADTASGNCWYWDGSQGQIRACNVVNSWAANCQSAEGYGMQIVGTHANVRSLQFSNFRCMYNQGGGIRLYAGQGVSFNNCHVGANNRAGGAAISRSGLFVENGTSDWTVIGGVFGGFADIPTNPQRYGIVINSTTTARYSIIGVDLQGNVVGPLYQIAGLTDRGNIRDCLGYISNKTGSATFTPPGTLVNGSERYITVTHGIGYTPLLEEITVWPLTGSRDSLISHWYVSNITATTFRLVVQGGWASGGQPAGETYWGWRFERSRGVGQ